jgi:hypothetical protein
MAGGHIDTVTPEELAAMLKPAEQRSKVRTAASFVLDGNGSIVGGNVGDIYKVPAGAEFYLRRVFFDISGATDPSTGSVALNVAGKYIKYLRSGTMIGYAIPLAPTAVAQVPGVEDWSEQQGPYLANGEKLQISTLGLTANGGLKVEIQGVLVTQLSPSDK